jgi:cAMP-dependent protein kinase regulator
MSDLSRDVHRVQPRDALQFCANWFQSRLEEQRTRTRALLAEPRSLSISLQLPKDHYVDDGTLGFSGTAPVSPTSQPLLSRAPRMSMWAEPGPFGTLDVPGNALLSDDNRDLRRSSGAPLFSFNDDSIPPDAPAPPPHNATGSPVAGFGDASPFAVGAQPVPFNAPDYLSPPNNLIYARRTSVSAESINVDSEAAAPLPVFAKSEAQMQRIKASIAANFLFRDLDEEQESGVLNAMREQPVAQDEVVIRQGDVGDYFYVVEDGLFHCYIRPDPLPPAWLDGGAQQDDHPPPPAKFTQPGYHPQYGKKVAECAPGSSFGELALMYGHPRAATVQAVEPSTLWSLDRITFRTIILTAAHKRRTMYEQFLTQVPLLVSLQPSERSKIADALVSKVYQDGEAVVRQGEMGDMFFFVEEGEAVVTKEVAGDEGEVRTIEVGTLHKGDYFGGASLFLLGMSVSIV